MSEAQNHENFDSQKAETFGSKILTALNDGALCLMLSLGHRSGLLDVLRTLPPSTSDKIAAAANLNERYVREWLGAMVTAGVVEVDPATGQFRLPLGTCRLPLPELPAADNMAVFSQYISAVRKCRR